MRSIYCVLFSAALSIFNTASAATLELDIAKMFPQQKLIQTVRIEAESLQAEITLNNGQMLDPLVIRQWPSFSDMTQILVQGPEVQFKVITQNGSEWTRSLSSFDFNLLNTTTDGRKEIVLDLHTRPLNKVWPQKNNKERAHLGYYLFKTLMLFADGNIHFQLSISGDSGSNAHPLIRIHYQLDKQNFDIQLQDQNDGLKIGFWKITSNRYGKMPLADLIINALRTMSEEYRNLNDKTQYDRLIEKILSGTDLFLDFTAPISDWTGINSTVEGSFDYLYNSEILFAHINNHFQLDAYDGHWSTALDSKSYFVTNLFDSFEWSQEFNFKHPEQDLKKVATWIQLHWSKQLADLIHMPSVRYYADYFPTYFVQGLTLAMSSLGVNQGDGTMSFILSSTNDSFAVCGLNPSETALLISTKIKEQIRGW